MAESKLRELSMEFSVDIINLVKYLKSNHESVIANQIGRSGTPHPSNNSINPNLNVFLSSDSNPSRRRNESRAEFESVEDHCDHRYDP